jgi:hypothetical protein
MNIMQHLRKIHNYKATLNLEYMFKINLISGFRFIILVLEYTRFKIISNSK